MSFEDRLRNGLRDEAGVAAPTSEAWQAVQRGARARRRNRAVGSSLLATAALVGVISVSLASNQSDDDRRIETPPAGVGAAPSETVAVTASGEVVVVDSSTGERVRVLADGADAETTLAVAPDGNYVYFDRPTGTEIPEREIVRVPPAGGEIERVTGGSQVAVSPDGRLLAFVVPPQRVTEQDTEPTRPARLVVAQIPESFENWTPFVLGDAFAGDVDQEISDLSFAPDSKWLTYAIAPTRDGNFLHRFDLGYGDPPLDERPVIPVPDGIEVQDSLGATGELLATRCDQVIDPMGFRPRAVALDATTGEVIRDLFWASGRCGEQQLAADSSGRHVVAVDGQGRLSRWSEGIAEPVELGEGYRSAAWLPGPAVPVTAKGDVAVAFQDGRIALIAPDGQLRTTLVDDTSTSPSLPGAAAVTMDDEYVYFSRLREVGPECTLSELLRVPRAGGTAEFVGAGADPAVSPDGSSLAYVAPLDGGCESVELVVRDLASGTERRYGSTTPVRLALPTWSPGGERVAVVVQGNTLPLVVALVDVASTATLDDAARVEVLAGSNVPPVAFLDDTTLLVPVNRSLGTGEVAEVDAATGRIGRTLFAFFYGGAEWRIADLEVRGTEVIVAAIGDVARGAPVGIYYGSTTSTAGLDQISTEPAWAIALDPRDR